mmetsp:Transcript_18400/g.29215  ORF Transcript_18400/g.29215 Transcript_18400/m.29215 type:complete len:209 (-) Transcript_18400:30-656(-)
MAANYFFAVAIVVRAVQGQACPALYDADDNPLWALNVCLESTEYGGSYKLTCDDDGNAIGKVYATSDCSVAGVSQDVPDTFVWDYAVCNGTRCAFAKVRQYTTINNDCSETDTFNEWALVIAACLSYPSNGYSEMYDCTDNNVTLQTYTNTNCEGTPTITTKYKDGICDTTASVSVLYEITECNHDKAYFWSIGTAVLIVSYIVAIFV